MKSKKEYRFDEEVMIVNNRLHIVNVEYNFGHIYKVIIRADGKIRKRKIYQGQDGRYYLLYCENRYYFDMKKLQEFFPQLKYLYRA